MLPWCYTFSKLKLLNLVLPLSSQPQEQCEQSQGKEEDPEEILSSEDEEEKEKVRDVHFTICTVWLSLFNLNQQINEMACWAPLSQEKPVTSSRKRKQPFNYYSNLLSNNTDSQEEYRKQVITKWWV